MTWDLLCVGDEGGKSLLGVDEDDALRALPSLPADRVDRADGQLADPQVSRDNVGAQGWGVVIRDDADGEAALAAIEPLVELRTRMQDGKAPRVLRWQDLADPVDWARKAYGKIPQLDRPLYVLVLGDLSAIPLDVERQLAALGALVGRIAFDSAAAYTAYASKVRDAEDGDDRDGLAAIVYNADDKSRPIRRAREHLVVPIVDALTKLRETAFGRHLLPVDELETDRKGLLDAAQRAGFLFTLSHGLGAPTRPGRTRESHLGALVTKAGELLTSEEVRGGPFLPGGVWFMFACFGAGSPSRSEYAPWLGGLRAAGMITAETVAEIAAANDGPPFIAALPKAALANPQGPVAVIGHLDQAWSYGYARPDEMPGVSDRFVRMWDAIALMARGARVGLARDELGVACRTLDQELLAHYQELQGKQPTRLQGLALTHTFMSRHDLRAYVVLGDPAARLPAPPPPRR